MPRGFSRTADQLVKLLQLARWFDLFMRLGLRKLVFQFTQLDL
jgi:hypothetical protein